MFPPLTVVNSAAVDVCVQVHFSVCVFNYFVFVPWNRIAELNRRRLRSVSEWLFFLCTVIGPALP